MNLSYTPPATIAAFMRDSEHRVRVLVGPVGSGKSMGCIMELMRRAGEQKPYNGVRHTRFALVRNTLQQLRQTVLNDIKEYLSPIIKFFVTDSTIQLRAPLPDGTILHSDWLLLPLDSKEDQQRLLSLQLTGAWVNEIREVDFSLIGPILGRCGRYPSGARGGPTWYGLIGDCNPWDSDSAYHEVMVLNPDPQWRLYHQPSGIGPDAENVQNLPMGYYDNLARNPDKEWVGVHVESVWGTSNAGQAVFRKSFDAGVHVRDLQPVTNPFRPIMVGLDFGRTPCAVVGQIDSFGRALIYREIVTEDMGIERMLREYLRPALSVEPFAGRKIFVVGDPAGSVRSQTRDESPFDILRTNGYLAYPATTNDIDARLVAVERLFTANLSGQPGLQIDRRGCPTLVRALGNMYRYKRNKDGKIQDLPEKLHPWSDVADALQYFCLGTSANYSGRVMLRVRPQQPVRAPSVAAWT